MNGWNLQIQMEIRCINSKNKQLPSLQVRVGLSLCWIGCFIYIYSMLLSRALLFSVEDCVYFQPVFCGNTNWILMLQKVFYDALETSDSLQVYWQIPLCWCWLFCLEGQGLSIMLQAKGQAVCWEGAGRVHWVALRQLHRILCTWETSRMLCS